MTRETSPAPRIPTRAVGLAWVAHTPSLQRVSLWVDLLADDGFCENAVRWVERIPCFGEIRQLQRVAAGDIRDFEGGKPLRIRRHRLGCDVAARQSPRRGGRYACHRHAVCILHRDLAGCFD